MRHAGFVIQKPGPQHDAITLRDLVPADRGLIAAVFERLSPRSRYLRFLTPLPSLSERTLDRLMDVDGREHVALIALRDGEALGVARYVRDRRDRGLADVAMAVIDAEQGRGLGRRLLVALLDVAAERGLRTLTFDLHADNRAMYGLVRSLGARMSSRGELLHGELPVPQTPGLPLAA